MQKNTEAPHYLPLALLILLALIWGSSFILIKRALLGFTAGQVGALRLSIASLFMLPWAVKALKEVPKDRLKYLGVVGIFGNFFPAFLFSWAQTGLASSLTGVLNGLTPLFTLVVGVIAFKVKFNPKQLIGLILGFAGSLSISFVGAGGQMGSMNYYALLVVIATICYALSANTIKNYLGGIRPLQVVALAIVSVGPVAIVYLLSTDFLERITQEESWLPLAYMSILAIVGTAMALIIFNKIIQMTSAVFATSVTYIIPIIAVAWGVVDGEALFPLHYLGMALILFGVYLVNRFK